MMNSNVSLAVRAQAELELRRRRAARSLTYSDLRIFTKQHSIEPLRVKRAQAELLQHIGQPGGRHLILKARQLGISTIVQAHLFLTAIRQSSRIGTLAHDDETTQKLRAMADMFWSQLPDASRPERGIDNATTTSYPRTHSTVYIASAGSKQKGRGGTYSHVHGSEVAFWTYGSALLAGLLQGVPDNGEIILESTPNGQQGWFYEQCMKALDGDESWQLHFFPWWWDEEYRIAGAEIDHYTGEEARLVELHGLDAEQIAWRRRKVRELGPLFAQEYPEDPHSAFIASGTGYFILQDDMFAAPMGVNRREGHRYIAGLDFGQSNDYTVCCVLDATTREQVDLLRVNRESWASMRGRVVKLCKRWDVQTLLAESNSMGSTNIEALESELSEAGCRTRLVSFETTHSSKTSAMSELRIALEEGGLRLQPHPAQRHELAAFTSRQTMTGLWQLSASNGGHDDTVIALALAWNANSQRTMSVGVTKWL